jgi:hypothetical protein
MATVKTNDNKIAMRVDFINNQKKVYQIYKKTLTNSTHHRVAIFKIKSLSEENALQLLKYFCI